MNATLVHHFLEQHANTTPDTTFVIEGSEQATYGQVNARANRLAAALLDLGIRRGDRVGLIAANSRMYVESYYGILKAGAVVVSLDASAGWQSHTRRLRLCGARGLICGERILRRVQGLENLRDLEFLIGPNSASALSDFDASWPPFIPYEPLLTGNASRVPSFRLSGDDRAAIVFTSGSTSEPKGVVLRHGNLVANTNSIVEYLRLSANDRMLVVLPFHYVYGKSLLNTHAAVGGSVVIENRFSFPQHALDTLETTAATGLAGVPSTFAILLNRSNFADRDFPNLRYVTQAGGALAPALLTRLANCLPGKQLYVMYGATEASARLSYLSPADLPRKLGSIGKAIPGVSLKVVCPDNRETSVGQVGELVARGPNIMEGYWNDPSGTAEVLDQAGYHTGDLAWRDEEGFLYLVGRSREMIKSGAHRISPQEIEQTLLEHPLVDEAAVIGVPDETLGEAIRAYVLPRPGTQPFPADVTKWCRTQLPASKVPGEVHIVAEFPRHGSGKIDKRALSDQIATASALSGATTCASV